MQCIIETKLFSKSLLALIGALFAAGLEYRRGIIYYVLELKLKLDRSLSLGVFVILNSTMQIAALFCVLIEQF